MSEKRDLKSILFDPLPVPEVRKTTVISLIGVCLNTVSIFLLCLLVAAWFFSFELRSPEANMLFLLGLGSLVGVFFWVCLFFWRYPGVATVGLRILEAVIVLALLEALRSY